MYNPAVKIAQSEGIDLPIMHVYLAGRIAGDCIDKCLKWRDDLILHYRHYKKTPDGYEAYPIAFLCPLNSGEAKSVDAKGLTSAIPPNLIYDKDLLSVEKADVVVANMDDFFEVPIKEYMDIGYNAGAMWPDINDAKNSAQYWRDAFFALRDRISSRRENLGTICEVAWALYLQKPLILIVPANRKETFEKHPFMRRASAIVTSVDELIQAKHLNILYKSMAGAIYR